MDGRPKGFNVRILFLVRDIRENLYIIRRGIESSFQNWPSKNFLIYLLQKRIVQVNLQ